MKKPLVSVCCITYNHQDYIEECINGFLKQESDFDVEFLIHDDASTDNTQSIIKSLVGEESRFKLILREKNIKSTGKAIFPILFEEAQGKYIAMCEGDDYWTDPLKLQKQVDFLEANKEYSLCYHRVNLEINGIVDTDENDITEKRYKNIPDKTKIGIDDLLKQGNFIHTPSVMFKKTDLKEIPFETKYSTVGDYFLYIMLTADNNKFIKKLQDKMAVYRRGVGVYSSLKSIDMSYSMLQYKICILSYLKEDEQKKILLKQTIKHFNGIKKRELNKKRISDFTFKELLTQLLKKIKSRVL
jgi:glycosyltransferase involved in cell wall biosynthesis